MSMNNSVIQEKLERGFSFYLNSNESKKGEGMGGESKGFRVWSDAMQESVQVLGISIPLVY
jgi:hypothetical protein